MESDAKIDESLYNRQLYVLDHLSMQKITQNNVLIIGMNGLGAEIGILRCFLSFFFLVDHSL